ncbi:C-_U-editing enzyme APOBEC-2b [Dunckerocampus dactyliophorus]|uniref:C->U-editing enzyme APOBEC-2b n=1 Tax=Dunckerocampus dactyliophorus TaxID=161453 RepID=UPI00240681E8|nr:C->U-editing enzyme APOBEC-2b [Dunckerocampus dactyliophorus]
MHLGYHSTCTHSLSLSPHPTLTCCYKIMADRNSRVSVKRKEKKTENKPTDEKEKEKTKGGKKQQDKVVKEPEKAPALVEEEKRNGEAGGAAGEEVKKSDGNGEFVPFELPPFEIVTGEQMSPFYFKFQFRNVEYSSGRNKTLLCYRVDTPGGTTEPLKGYLEDEHATAHAEEAFFQQVLPNSNTSQEYDVTWYMSSSPCVACSAKLANVLQQRKKVRLCIFCSRLFEWEEPEIVEGLKALVNAGCKVRMMKPSDFLHVWETYVEKEDQTFTPWEDCQENYNYYVEKLADILK